MYNINELVERCRYKHNSHDDTIKTIKSLYGLTDEQINNQDDDLIVYKDGGFKQKKVSINRPGNFHLNESSPLYDFLQNQKCLNFSNEGVRCVDNVDDSNSTISYGEFDNIQKKTKTTLAIKQSKSNKFAYVDAEELLNALNDRSCIGKKTINFNGIILDRTDATNVLSALNEMLSKKTLTNKGDKATELEKGGYYSRICIAGNVPVFDNGARYNQFVIGYPAWPDYSVNGVAGRENKVKPVNEYENDIRQIIELQIAVLRKNGIKDLIITCPKDFLSYIEHNTVGLRINDYRDAFKEAVLGVAVANEDIKFHISNFEGYFNPSTEYNIENTSEKKPNNLFLAVHRYNGKDTILDSTKLQMFLNGGNNNGSRKVAFSINPHPTNGCGNGCLGKNGGKAVDENFARIAPLTPAIMNPDTNTYLNVIGRRAGIVGNLLSNNTYKPIPIRVDESCMGRFEEIEKQTPQYQIKQYNDWQQNQPPIKQPPLEILTPKQIEDFNIYYKDLKSRGALHLMKVNKSLQFEERIKSIKAKFDSILNYIRIEGNKQEQNNDNRTTKPMIKAFLSNRKISDGKLTQMIADANKYKEILLGNEELCKAVLGSSVPFLYETGGNTHRTRSYNGFGIQFGVYSDGMQVHLLDNEFFSDHLDGNSRQILNGLRINFNGRFNINDPKQANMLMMVKANPHFVLNHLHELGCKFEDKDGNELPKEQAEAILKEVARVTELKKQIDKLNRIREDRAKIVPITDKTNFDIKICDVLIVCSTDEKIRDEFFGKGADINDINTYFLRVVKQDGFIHNCFPNDRITNLNACKQAFSTLLSTPEYKNNLSEVFKLELKQVSENFQNSLPKQSNLSRSTSVFF